MQSKRKRWRSLPPMSRKRLSRSAHPTPAGRQRLAKPSAVAIARTDIAARCQRAAVDCAHNHISSGGARCGSRWISSPIEIRTQAFGGGDLTAEKALTTGRYDSSTGRHGRTSTQPHLDAVCVEAVRQTVRRWLYCTLTRPMRPYLNEAVCQSSHVITRPQDNAAARRRP